MAGKKRGKKGGGTAPKGGGTAEERRVAQQNLNIAQEEKKRLEAELGEGAEKTLEYKEAMVELNKALLENARVTGANKDLIKDYTKRIKESNEAAQNAKKATDDFSSALGNTIKTFTGITDSSNTLIGSFFKLRKETGGSAAAFKKAKEQFSETFTTLNVGLSILQKVTQSTIALAVANDSALASFNKSTGAAGHYNDELIQLEKINRATGISTAELGDSYSSLISGVSGFGIMAESQRMELGTLSAQYGKVGVASSDFAGILQSSTNMMGLGAAGATQMQEAAFDLAQELGRNVSEVFSELNQALPKLALYSGDVTGMFVELEEQAHATGMAVGELMDMAAGYRTFDSAAEAAGNLNAVLGTQLFSTMGMLEAQLEGPAAVMEYMTDNLSNSIGDWNTLNTFQKEAVANAAKMSVESMATLMNQRDMTAEQRREAAQIEDAMATARSMGEEMKILMAEFAVAVQPVFEIFKGIVGGLSAMMQGLNKFTGGFAGIITIGIAIGAMYAANLLKTKMQNALTKKRVLETNKLLDVWKKIVATIAKANKLESKSSTTSRATTTGSTQTTSAAPGAPTSSGGLFAVGSRMNMGTSLAAGMIGAQVKDGEGGIRDRAGGALQGAAMGLSMGGPWGALAGGIGGALGLFADGTDSTPRGPAIVGEEGPELLVPPPGSAVVNNSSMTALANGAGGGDNAAVVAAVRALGAKMDTMITKLGNSGDFVMQVNSREFGRVINEHLGEDGYQPLRLKTA